jgi:adenosine 3'-phospho 5'-phosphosulfate transporter B2
MLVAKEVVITTTALVVYGLLQERVMTRGWGAAQERFANTAADSAFLVLSNRLVTLAALALHSWRAGHSWVPAAPLRSYCLVSASNMVSTL